MLCSQNKLQRRLRHQRKHLGKTLRACAREAQVSPSYLSAVETGKSPCSRRLAAKLERIFGLKAGELENRYYFPPLGRRPISADQKRILREVAAARLVDFQSTPVEEPTVVAPPRYPWPATPNRVADLLGRLGEVMGAEAQSVVSRLESDHLTNENFWRVLNSVRLDSWPERRLVASLARESAGPIRISARRLGVRTPLVQGRTGREDRHVARPAFVFERSGISAVVWPQRTVRAGKSHPRLDFLALVAKQGKKVVVDIEVNGPDHDVVRDTKRFRKLGLPVVRVPHTELRDPHLLERIFAVLDKIVETATEAVWADLPPGEGTIDVAA